MYAYVHVCVFVGIHMCVFVCMYVCMCVCTFVFCICKHAHLEYRMCLQWSGDQAPGLFRERNLYTPVSVSYVMCECVLESHGTFTYTFTHMHSHMYMYMYMLDWNSDLYVYLPTYIYFPKASMCVCVCVRVYVCMQAWRQHAAGEKESV